MKRNLIALFGALMLSGAALAVELDEVTIEQEVSGIKLAIPVKSSLEVTTTPQTLELRVDLDANLKALQDNFMRLGGTFDLPSDNCPSYGQHPVAKLLGASLRPEGNLAVVHAKLNVQMWDCQKGLPGTGTTVTWKNKCVGVAGKKFCTKVPVKVAVKPGPDIKNKLVEDDVDASIAFTASTPDGMRIDLVPGNVDVHLHSEIAKFLNSIAGMLGSSASQVARRKIGDFVDAGLLGKSIPEELLKYHPKVSNISFYTRADGTLGLRASFSSVLTGEQLTQFIAQALKTIDD